MASDRSLIRIARPRGARLRAIVHSHGWYQLAPFSLEEKPLVLHGALTLGSDAIAFSIGEAGAYFSIRVHAALDANDRAAIRAQIIEMLSLDESLDDLYALTDGHERLGYARRHGAGRMLRSATVWEDLVKVLLTTNCSWALTKKMNERLVDSLGSVTQHGRRAFPTPAQMAAVDEAFYRDVVRAGYRAPHLAKIARAVREGEHALPTRGARHHADDVVRDALLELPGFGPYAADNVLRLLGRFAYLGLDSACRAELKQIYGGKDQAAIDRAAARRYAPFGRWAGLAMWLDVTRGWHARG